MRATNMPVVVGFDGSQSSGRVAWWASAQADDDRRDLRIVAVTTSSRAQPAPAGGIPVPDTLRQELDSLLVTLQQTRPRLTVSGCCVPGDAAAVLSAYSAHATMTVLGGCGVADRSMCGDSVALKVAAQAHGPVVVVPDTGVRTRGTGTAVLVGVDSSAASQSALNFAFDEASQRRKPLIALHAWAVPGTDAPSGRNSPNQALVDAADEQRQLLIEMLAGWRVRYPTVPVQPIVTLGSPAGQLLLHSRRADLVVVGASRTNQSDGAQLDPTSRELLHRCTTRVAVAPVQSETAPLHRRARHSLAGA